MSVPADGTGTGRRPGGGPEASADDPRERTPIDEYGLIGDTRTAALVSPSGSIDWLCLPRFDSAPVFGRLVGGEDAGCFAVGPFDGEAPTDRGYEPRTATVRTVWSIGAGRLLLRDSMIGEVSGTLLPATTLVRRLDAFGHPFRCRIRLRPRFGYERAPPDRIRRRRDGLVVEHAKIAFAITTDAPGELDLDEDLIFDLHPGSPVTVVLTTSRIGPLVFVPPTIARDAADRDERGWRSWSRAITPHVDGDAPVGRSDRVEAVVRSLITLQLLTYSPSGAPVAAPTTSLPEGLGGVRNWDYRYAWPRDASIGVDAFLGHGKHREARAFLAFLRHAGRLALPRLPTLFTLDGRRVPGERDLVDWPGYANSRPVRVGNAASTQFQLDGYGWVLNAAWQYVDAGHHLDQTTWRMMRSFVDRVADCWPLPDAGIWERRDEPRHHVHSKLMAWSALDRGARIADGRSRRDHLRARRWRSARDELGADIRRRGWNASVGAYTATYDSTDLDAAVLLLPQISFEPNDSPRVIATVDAIRRSLSPDGVLVHRYRTDDGLPGDEGAFLPCSFWLVSALALTGRVPEAHRVFQELLDRRGPFGLWPEEIDPATDAPLGNYPQALTHSTMAQAALVLRDTP